MKISARPTRSVSTPNIIVESKYCALARWNSDTMEGDRQRCLDAGMDDYIAKPIIAIELYTVLEKTRVSTQGSSLSSADPFDPESTLARCEGDHKLLAGLVEIFLADCPGYSDRLREGATANDCQALYRATHTLKGPRGTLALDNAIIPVVILEQITGRSDLADTIPTIGLQTREWERTESQLAAWVAGTPKETAP